MQQQQQKKKRQMDFCHALMKLIKLVDPRSDKNDETFSGFYVHTDGPLSWILNNNESIMFKFIRKLMKPKVGHFNEDGRAALSIYKDEDDGVLCLVTMTKVSGYVRHV